MWTVTGEPRYVVNTFGLGHNHGGTGLFVEEYYNQNIAASNYFSALDGDKAVAYANKVAERRGDTNDVGKFEKMIEVLIPEAVTIRPEVEHGEGDRSSTRSMPSQRRLPTARQLACWLSWLRHRRLTSKL